MTGNKGQEVSGEEAEGCRGQSRSPGNGGGGLTHSGVGDYWVGGVKCPTKYKQWVTSVQEKV